MNSSSSDQTRDDSNYLRYTQTQDLVTQIKGGGSVQLNAGRDIVGTGAELQAGGALGIVALNDVKLGVGSSTYSFGASLTTNESDMFGSTSTREQRTTSQSNAIAYTLSGGSVNVLAGNDATLEGVKIDAQGDASVVAMNRLIVGPAYNTSTDSYSYESTSTGLGMGSRTQADQLAQSTLQRTEISGGNVTLRSLEGDAYVSGTTLNADGTVTLGAANGRLYLDGAQTQTTTSHQSSSSDLLMQEAKGEGGTEQVTNYNQINAGRVVFDAPAITAQIGSRDSALQLAQQPGMGWMNQLSTDPALQGRLDWVTIQDASSHWQYQQQGLSPVGAALVSVAVAYFTAGMGAEFAIAQGLTTTTATGAVALTTTGTIVAGATSAAITALGSRVVIAFAAHPGDLGAVLQDLGSSDSVKGLVSAILSGGALGALDLNAIGQATADAGAQSFPVQLAQNIQGGLARAVINTAVFGGSLEDNIKANLLTGLIDTVAAQGAFEIGNLTQAGVLDDFANKLAHAIAGCATAALRTNGNCSAGALGAVVGELAAESYGSKADTVQFASMISALVATATGMNADDVMLASQAGGNAAANNYVSHSPFANVKNLVDKENARLTEACGQNCTQADFRNIDLQMQKLEAAAQLLEIQKNSTLTDKQAMQLGENIAALLPFYGTPIALYQAISGKSLSGQDLSGVERFFNGVAAAVPAGSAGLKLIDSFMADMKLASTFGGIAADGTMLMDFTKLTNAQKGVVGELLGAETVKVVLPDATRLGRLGEVGSQGIDDLYKVSSATADYVIVEYKFGTSTLNATADGVQMSDGWVLGSDRVLNTVGNPQEALRIKDALTAGRVEKWVVHTDPAGGTTVWIVDAAGKVVPANSSVTSKLLGGAK